MSANPNKMPREVWLELRKPWRPKWRLSPSAMSSNPEDTTNTRFLSFKGQFVNQTSGLSSRIARRNLFRAYRRQTCLESARGEKISRRSKADYWRSAWGGCIFLFARNPVASRVQRRSMKSKQRGPTHSHR